MLIDTSGGKLIDTSFDFRSDTRPGRDPDADSPLGDWHPYSSLKTKPCMPSLRGTPFSSTLDIGSHLLRVTSA